MSSIKSIIVIGASAGGLQAISVLLEKIPAKLDLAIFVVLHVSRSSHADVLVHHLQKKQAIRVVCPKTVKKYKLAMFISPGRIFTCC